MYAGDARHKREAYGAAAHARTPVQVAAGLFCCFSRSLLELELQCKLLQVTAIEFGFVV